MTEPEETVNLDEQPGDLAGDSVSQGAPPVINPLLLASVSGQVKDTAGNLWGFAIIQFSLFNPSGQPVIELSTGLVIPNPEPIVCDGTGNFSDALQKTDSIVPAGCLWQLTIFPFNNQRNGQTLAPFLLTAPINSVTMTAMISTQLRPHTDPPLVIPMSNSGSAGQSTLNGSVYFDVETGKLMLMDPATGNYIVIGPA